jgi:hypothetical protein
MNELTFITSISGFIAALLVWVPFANFLRIIKKDHTDHARLEERHTMELSQIKVDLQEAHNKLRDQDIRITRTQESLIEIKADIKHLVSAVDKISQVLERIHSK